MYSVLNKDNNRPLSNYASVPANNDLKSRLVLRCAVAISQFHNHAQYVEAVCLTGHTSCKHGGLYE